MQKLGEIFKKFLPADAINFNGPSYVIPAAAVYNGLMTCRSLIHMFKRDGGAQSIASIDCTVAGGSNIIAMFAQWGASQMVLAVTIWLVIIRYRGLIPLMLSVCLLEHFLRLVAGKLKPLSTAKEPPGKRYRGLMILYIVVLLAASLVDTT